MALYRLEAKIIGRKYAAKTRGRNRGKEIKKTRSVVAASAYRTGKNLRDERTGERHNYSSRSKGVIESAILHPDNAPAWVSDSELLWNKAEAAEKRKDAQLAREFILAVPPELTPKEQFQLAVDWVKKDLVSVGMVAEVSLHHPKTGTNPHVHVLCTLRTLDGDKFNAKKSREWNAKPMLRDWRKSWCDAENAALEKAGHPERVDHRSLKDRGLDQLPQPKIGPTATAMKREGKVADPERFQAARHVEILNEVMPLRRAVENFNKAPAEPPHDRTWLARATAFMSKARKAVRETVIDTWKMLLNAPPYRAPKAAPVPVASREPERSR